MVISVCLLCAKMMRINGSNEIVMAVFQVMGQGLNGVYRPT